MERFSDFARTTPALEGKKIGIEQILNTEIIVEDYRINESKFKKNGNEKYVRIQFRKSEGGELFVCFTGSEVLAGQLRESEGHFPFLAKIVRINRYYSFK